MLLSRFIKPDSGTEVQHDSTLVGTGSGSSPLKVAPRIALINYTPSADDDPFGVLGQFTWDDDYIYVKTSAGWARTALTIIP